MVFKGIRNKKIITHQWKGSKITILPLQVQTGTSSDKDKKLNKVHQFFAEKT